MRHDVQHQAFYERMGGEVKYLQVYGRWTLRVDGTTAQEFEGTYEDAANRVLDLWLGHGETIKIDLLLGDRVVAAWDCPPYLPAPSGQAATAALQKLSGQAQAIVSASPGVSLNAWYAATFTREIVPYVQAGGGTVNLMLLTDRIRHDPMLGPHLLRWLTVYAAAVEIIERTTNIPN